MQKMALIVFCCLSIHNLSAQGINFFEGSWDEIVAESQKSKKLIFVDAYTNWCGPCKMMAKQVFTQDVVGHFFNENFINVKMDMENPDNIDFRSKYPVNAYPTLFFIGPDEEIVNKGVGAKRADGLIAFAKESIKKDDRTSQYEARYAKGERGFTLMLNYISELNKVGKPSLKIANEYLSSKPAITDKQKATFLFAATKEADSKLYDAFTAQKKNIIALKGEAAYYKKVKVACLETVKKAVEFEYFDLLEEAKQKMKQSKHQEAKTFGYEADMYFYENLGLVKEYAGASKNYYDKVAKKDEEKLKKLSETLLKKFLKNEECQKLVEKCGDSLVDIDNSWQNLFIKAKILDKLGKPVEAAQYAGKAFQKVEASDKRSKKGIEMFIEQLKRKV